MACVSLAQAYITIRELAKMEAEKRDAPRVGGFVFVRASYGGMERGNDRNSGAGTVFMVQCDG